MHPILELDFTTWNREQDLVLPGSAKLLKSQQIFCPARGQEGVRIVREQLLVCSVYQLVNKNRPTDNRHRPQEKAKTQPKSWQPQPPQSTNHTPFTPSCP